VGKSLSIQGEEMTRKKKPNTNSPFFMHEKVLFIQIDRFLTSCRKTIHSSGTVGIE
jgi:hypothetical protein